MVAAPHVLNPHVSFEREIVFRNTSSCFPCALFSSKRHCSACCIKREVKGSDSPTRRRARASSMQSRSDARSGVALRRARTGPCARGSAAGCCSTASAAAAFFGRPASLLGAPASLLGAARFPAFRWASACLCQKQRGQCDQHTCKSSQNGATAPLASPREWGGAWTGCQANPAPLPARRPVKVGASASAPARRALKPGKFQQQVG